MARRWMQLELVSAAAEPQASGDRERLETVERQRRPVLHVVLLVERLQLASGLRRIGRERRRGALTAAERRVREGVATEQVVPVAVRRQQPGDGKAGLLEHPR